MAATKALRGVIYARYSSDNQREESIEGQLRENTAFAEKHGIQIVNTYIDRAFSAKTDNRPEFQRMIKESSKKHFDVVIVWKLDRFSRNRFDSAKYKALLRMNGVKVVSATESISEGAEGIILESVLEGMAEYYSADLAEKVTRGMTENALKHMYNGGVCPYGYCVDANQQYAIDPSRAPLVLEIFSRYAGGDSITEILEDLDARGIRTNKGNRFNKSSIARMFANRKYIGEYRFKDVVIPNAIPPIVPQELFDRVQVRMEKNKHATSKSKAPETYLLTTKLYCGTCKSMMVGDSANKPNGVIYRYYKCAAAKRHECNRKAIRKDYIEDQVLNGILRVLHDEILLGKMADAVIALLGEGSSMLPALQAQLRETCSAIDNILRAIEQGVFTRTTKDRLRELEATEDALREAIAEEEAKLPKIDRDMILMTLHKFRDLDIRITKNKERLIDGFVKAIFVYDDRFEVFTTYTDESFSIPTQEELDRMTSSSPVGALASPKNSSPFGEEFFGIPMGIERAAPATPG